MFALDHVHYSRWLSVFLRNIEMLEDTNKNVFQNFMEGCFVVTKSGKLFSCIAEGKGHEETTKVLNEMGVLLEFSTVKNLFWNAWLVVRF